MIDNTDFILEDERIINFKLNVFRNFTKVLVSYQDR